MNNGNFLKEIINYLESNYLIFLVAYILVVIVQLIVLYKKSSGMRIILFSVHKIIAFVAIAYLLLYSKNILGFYLYVIGVVTLAFSCSIIKKEKIFSVISNTSFSNIINFICYFKKLWCL